MASGGDKPLQGMGRGGRGAALLAAYKTLSPGITESAKPSSSTSVPSPTESSNIPAVGRGAVLQSLLAGRGRAALPVTEVSVPAQVLGRGAHVATGRGHMPVGRARFLPSSDTSSSSSVSMASPSSAASGSKSASTPSPPIAEMEELTIGRYKGESGRPADLEVNYIRLKICSGKGVYEYHVSFEPSVDSRNMKFRVVNQPEVRAIIGQVKSFDGAKLYLPKRLDQEVWVATKLPTDNSEVKVCIKYVGVCKACDLLHLYNVLFRRIMAILKMVQVGRNYFDPQGGIPVLQHRLEIWPGYITAVQEYEGGIMLQADASFRVLRTITAMEVMSEVMSAKKGKEEVERTIIGTIVLTRYNNKTYKVDDIAWDLNPKSTFTTHDGQQITYVDYYKKAYDIAITDCRQPLLLSCSKKRKPEEKEKILCLIPELCYMTGLTDSMRSDFKIMKDIATHTRVNPARRQQCFESFIRNINQTADAKKVLNDWNLELDESPVSLQGRLLDSEEISLKKTHFVVSKEADWGRQITNADVRVAVDLNVWLCIFTKRDSGKVQEFIGMMKRVAPNMGIRINEPKRIVIDNDRTETYCQALRGNINVNVQMAVIIFPNPRDDRYSAVKKVCCIEVPVPSQVVNVRTISAQNRLRSVCQKIVLQMNCKVGGELWALHIPLNNIMVCGLDTYHDSAQRKQSILGFVASVNRDLTRWFSRTTTQRAGQELGDALKVLFISALRKYHAVNHVLPQKIFIFRDGVGDGMLNTVAQYEVQQLSSCFENIQTDYCPALSVVVVQKRINTRIYVKQNGSLGNPAPGTVLDHSVTRKKLYDFFLVSQHVGQGTVTPTHFIVVHDSSTLKPEHIQRLTYKMTHLYYNWPGTVRVPAPCQYAHKLAYLVGQSLHKEASECLADKLFYL